MEHVESSIEEHDVGRIARDVDGAGAPVRSMTASPVPLATDVPA